MLLLHALMRAGLTEPWSCPADCDFALAAVASRPRSTGPNLEYVILAGSSLSRTKNLGDSLHHSLAYSLPRGHRVQPSALCWGSPGSTPGRGWFDSRRYRPTTSPVTAVVDARLRGCAALHACTHACTSRLRTHMPVPLSSLTMNLRVHAWRPGRV